MNPFQLNYVKFTNIVHYYIQGTTIDLTISYVKVIAFLSGVPKPFNVFSCHTTL